MDRESKTVRYHVNDFTQYIHEFETPRGHVRYAVGQWDEEHAQFIRPFDTTEHKLTGCNAEFSRSAAGMQSYRTRKQALARARYLFHEIATREERRLYPGAFTNYSN